MKNRKPIQRIVTLELHTYAAFCRWLRNTQGTTVGDLIKKSDDEQSLKLDEFLELIAKDKDT